MSISTLAAHTCLRYFAYVRITITMFVYNVLHGFLLFVDIIILIKINIRERYVYYDSCNLRILFLLNPPYSVFNYAPYFFT